MRKSLAIATFIVAGAGALGAGAAVLNFKGSDTLGDLTNELISTHNAQQQTITGAPFCEFGSDGGAFSLPDGGTYLQAFNGNLNYLGGGSGGGETAMTNGTQAIAPMSRFLANGICKGVAGDTINEASGFTNNLLTSGAVDAGGTEATLANGLVISLDGLSILTSNQSGGNPSCNGDAADTNCNGEATFGLAFNVQVPLTCADGGTGTYTFANYRDILRVLYFGIDNTITPNHDCSSCIRQSIANKWGSLFENPSCAGTGIGNAGHTNCLTLQHIFRRDDNSGTTDIFASLLGQSGPNVTSNAVDPAIGTANQDGSASPYAYAMGTDPFCNDFQSLTGGSAKNPAGYGIFQPGLNPPSTPNANVGFVLAGSGTLAKPGNNGIVPNDMQDLDPIRRPCEGVGPGKGTATSPNPEEQVCERGTWDIANTTIVTVPTGGLDGGASIAYNCGANDAGVCPAGEQCLGGQCWGARDLNAETLVFSQPGCPGGASTCSVAGGGTTCPFNEVFANGQCFTRPNQGSLGLLLAAIDTTQQAQGDAFTNFNLQYNVGTAAPFTANTCGGSPADTLAPFVYRYTFAAGAVHAFRTTGLCPNGDISIGAGGLCHVPGDLNGNPNCFLVNSGVNTVAATTCATGGAVGGGQGSTDGQTCTGLGPDPANVDPKVYHLYSYTKDVNANWIQAFDDAHRPMLGGAFYRIHTTQDMFAPNNTGAAGSAICNQANMTDQIGCLVQASPCSLGYAGRHAEQVLASFTGAPGATGLRLIGVPDAVACIQGTAVNPPIFQYPFSRKLYLNSLAGFQNASIPEATLAACENTQDLIDNVVQKNFFIPLPSAVNGGVPYCEDFNEQMLCPQGGSLGALSGNHDGCGNTSGIGGGFETICGNGIREAYEDCDFGTNGVSDAGVVQPLADGGAANGSPGSACSNICRNQ